MYTLLRAGDFGNTMETWPNYAQVMECDRYLPTISIRYKGEPLGKFFAYNEPNRFLHVGGIMQAWEARGANTSGWADTRGLVIFSETAPDDQLIIQGQLTRDHRGLVLEYATDKGVNMRVSMQSPKIRMGLAAYYVLNTLLDEDSTSHLYDLLDTYDDGGCPVIEFTYYAVPCGVENDRLIVWEVRHY
jgi:hypothetical protein